MSNWPEAQYIPTDAAEPSGAPLMTQLREGWGAWSSAVDRQALKGQAPAAKSGKS